VEQKLFQKLASLGLCLWLAACSSSPPEVPVCCNIKGTTLAPKKATSRPYQALGAWYYPQPHYEYAEEGMASFYGGGDAFHGRPTATGERYDMNGITAAHKTVPLPCIAKVTNLENGRELIVKVNDRGPFISGRIIDVSRRSAQLLGFETNGLARVRVETLVPESLALNGIDPSTAMVAQAAPTVPIATPELCAPDTLFEALEGAPAVVETPLPETPVMMVEAPATDPVMVAAAPLPPPPTNPSPLPVKLEVPTSTGIFVYVGEYETHAKAQAMSRSLDGFADSPAGIIKNNGPRPYAARLGPLPSMSQANQVLDQLVNAGHLISRIVIQR